MDNDELVMFELRKPYWATFFRGWGIVWRDDGENTKTVVSFDYDEAPLVEGHLFKLYNQNGSGVLFSPQKEKIVLSFEKMNSLTDNLLYVKQGGKWGVFDIQKENFLFFCEYENLKYYSTGEVLTLYIQRNKGFLYSLEKEKKLFNFDDLDEITASFLWIKQGGSRFIFDLKNKKTTYRLDMIVPFFGTLYRVAHKGREGFFCSKSGEISWR